MADIHIFRGLYIHSISLSFICLIFFILAFRVYNMWYLPHNLKRKWSVILHILVILRNLVEGLFQNPSLEIGVPIYIQNFLGHGFGYFVAAFFPIYWNATMDIKQLKLHARYGPLILTVPIIAIYFIVLPMNSDLRSIRSYAFIVPLLYGAFLILHISLNIYKDYKTEANKAAQKDKVLILFSVTMWLASPAIGFYYPQWVEDMVINSIFILVNIIFVRKDGLAGKKIIKRNEHLNIIFSTKDSDALFDLNCKRLHISSAESLVAKLYIDGMTRKEIAEKQNIVISTVDWHIANIHKKAGTSGIKSRKIRKTSLAEILTSINDI